MWSSNAWSTSPKLVPGLEPIQHMKGKSCPTHGRTMPTALAPRKAAVDSKGPKGRREVNRTPPRPPVDKRWGKGREQAPVSQGEQTEE